MGKIKICSICQKEYVGFGNNAQPINNRRCCDRCNDLVIVARMNAITKKELLSKMHSKKGSK